MNTTETTLPPDADPSRPAPVGWQSFGWRITFTALTVALGLVGFFSGVGVTDRPSIGSGGPLTYFYYTLGLFLFGGLDLGTPTGGPVYGRVALWIAYFAAPTITASTVIQTVLRLVAADRLRQLRLRQHIVVIGCERLTHLYLRRLRDSSKHASVIVVGAPGEGAKLRELRERFRVHIHEGRPTSRVVLRRLNLDRAARVLVLTRDDFDSFDIATRMIELYPSVTGRLVVQVHDLLFLRSIQHLKLPVLTAVFNSHEIAAQRFMNAELLDHFQRTVEKDSIIIAGFSHFGQTLLNELQTHAAGQFDRVLILDTEAKVRAATFEEQVGFGADVQPEVLDGDIRFPDVWKRVNQRIDLTQGAPVVIVGSGDDQANIRVALTLAKQYPNVLIVARNEAQWSFADSLAKASPVRIVNVVELAAQGMPDEWFEPRPERRSGRARIRPSGSDVADSGMNPA